MLTVLYILQSVFLSMLCYNTGVELYQNKQYRQAIIWLRESYEISKHRHSVGPKNQVTKHFFNQYFMLSI